MMENLTRRSAIQQGLTLTAGVLFPWNAFSSPTPAHPLSNADRTLINIVREVTTEVKQIMVHPLLRDRMTIDKIDGVKVELLNVYRLRWAPRGEITYYNVSHSPRMDKIAHHPVIGNHYTAPADLIEEWVNLNAYSQKFVPCHFSKKRIS